MKYFVKTPWWLKKIYSSYIWSVDTKEKILYLTFDDGPHSIATPFVLNELKKYNAKASFFCIGKNVLAEQGIYKRIIDEGHAVGNHTHSHFNGWKTKDDVYLKDVTEAGKYIDSFLFRPPYGRITSFQAKNIHSALKKPVANIIMWDVLSGDFDNFLTGQQCLQNIILNAKKGSIIVCHDSQKSFSKLEFFLPLVLNFFEKEGYRFDKIVG
ncbi:MAG: polysaccharide deacetylase family protein [Chitinophagaceae bacterium]